MPLDGISTFYLASELHDFLKGSRIDKIYQINKYDLYLMIRGTGGNSRLLLSANPVAPRAHITFFTKENPALPPNFCMLLRKHLSGARIQKVTSPDYERIIEIQVTITDDLGDTKNKCLIIEMMGKYSNIILTGESGVIYDSLLHVDSRMSRVREVMPARIYSYPPRQNKYSPKEALAILSDDRMPILEDSKKRPLEKALQESLLGFSPLLAREICYLSGIDKRTGYRQITPEDKKCLIRSTKELLARITEGNFKPGTYHVQDEKKPHDFHALFLRDAGIYTPSPSLSNAMDRVFTEIEKEMDFERKKKRITFLTSVALSHAVRKRNVHQADVDGCKNAKTWQKYGQLLLANHYQIPKGSSFFDAVDYEADPPETVRIPMETNRTVSENAKIYFNRYSKEKNRLAAAGAFLEEDEKTVEYLSSLHQAAESATGEEDLALIAEELQIEGASPALEKKNRREEQRQKEAARMHPGKSKSGKVSERAFRAAAKAAAARTKEKNTKKRISLSDRESFRKYTSHNGMTILCGRNNLQNDLLTMKTAAPDDLWFHVQKMPGTHVVLRCEKRTPAEKDILEAAGIAAFFSRSAAKAAVGDAMSGGLKLSVDYCPVKNVKKLPKAKPGMVIYEHYKTLITEPLNPAELE